MPAVAVDYVEYRLTFRAPLRIGETHRETADHAPRMSSDWLRRAIASAFRELHGKPMDTADTAGVRLSSAFPFTAEHGALAPAEFAGGALVRLEAPHEGPVAVSSWPWVVSSRARASFNRRTGRRAERFSVTDVRFLDGAGMWFGVRFDDDNGTTATATTEFRREFDAALRYLGDCGIGGGRSTGSGIFSLASVRDISLSTTTGAAVDPTAWWVLSRFRPSENEFAGGRLLAGPAAVKWATWPIPDSESVIRFIGEGSVIAGHDGLDPRRAGQTAPITVGSADARCGFLFALPAPLLNSAAAK